MAARDRIGSRVYCTTCRNLKKPIGRSAPLGSWYCDDDCPGYREEPHVGSLWPGERASEFGYPVSDVGTEPSPSSVRADHGPD
jgi:hypothetical protein